MKKFIFVVLCIISMNNAFSQVALKLEAGGGPTFGKKGVFENRHWYLDKGTTLNGNIGLLAEIMLSKEHPFLIETGVVVGGLEAAYEGYDLGTKDIFFFRIPIKFDYRLKLTDKSSLTFGLGPALNWEFGDYEGKEGSFQVGVIPSVAYRYRKFSVGLSYFNPLIYNGPKDLNKNLLTLTLGLTFNLNPHWGGWSVIGQSAAAIGEAAGSLNTNYNSFTDDYQSNDSSSTGSNRTVPQRGDGHKILMEGKKFQTASRQYWDYANRLSEMKTFPDRYSDSKRKEYQKKMKELRNKYDLGYSEWEDWDGKL